MPPRALSQSYRFWLAAFATRGPRVFRAPRRFRQFAPWLAAAVLILSVLALGAASRASATNVSGTISTDTTWTLANSPYVLTGNVSVAAGVTLTIEPGVVVQGNAHSRELTVSGSLSAIGTASAPITFTSTADSAAGQWYRLHFNGSGASTLKHVNIRYGGSNWNDMMIYVTAGSLTVEDSLISRSSRVGIKTFSASGTGATLVMRRTKVENNGSHGIFVFNAHAEIDDSASWSNGSDGLKVWVASGYPGTPSVITDTSIWNNGGTGAQLSQDSTVAALAPDASGNAIYDNGSFTLAQADTWRQLTIERSSLDVDWRANYWGPVRFIPCVYGSQNGHLSFGAPDPLATTSFPIERGPVSHSLASSGLNYCGNDGLLVNDPLVAQPDLYFDPPPPIFDGLATAQTRGCDLCDQENPELALAHDQPELNSLEYTAQPVSTASGSLTETATDLQVAGPGLPFVWSRTYNSQDTSSGPLGVGWAHAFNAKITVVNTTTGELEYGSGSGQLTRFLKTSGGSTGSATYGGKGFDGTMKRLSNNSYELTTRDRRVFSFDSSGNLTQIKPRFLPATTLAYTSGKLSSITDSAGRSATITYSGSNPALIDRVTLADGRYVEYGYTGGRLTSVRDPRGKTWTLAYDANGRLESIRDPLNRYELQNVQYDGQGRVTSEQNGTGDATTYAYTSSDGYELTTVTIPGRGSWVYKHLGNMLMSVIDPLNRTTSYTYDGMGRKATETDGRGNTSRYEYDAYGNVIKQVAPSPLGYTTSRTFNATNDLLTETDARGNTTTNVYATSTDADYQAGQLKTVTDRENGVTTFKYWTTTSSPTPPATNVGLLKSVTDQRSKATAYDYDASGNLTKVTSPLGLKTTFTYDSSGRKTGRRDPRGNVPDPPSGFLTQWAYDAVDHVTTLTDARGNETTYSYYDNEQLWKQTRTDTGGAARVTTFDYDSDNRLWKATDPRNGVETRLYWPDGQLKSVESAEGRKTSYGYDNAGQLTSMIEPNGNATGATASDWTWTYGYDNAGNRTTEAHADAGTTTIAYDAINRPYQWTDPLSHLSSVQYDANGNVTQRTDGLNHSSSNTYDKLDRLKTETDERGKTWTHAYYATGEKESVTTPLGNKTSYAIDDDGRTSSMVEARGNISGATPTDYTWAYAYDANDNRTKITDPLGNEIAYEYNALGDVTKITDQRGNETTFTYDVMNRLSKVTPPAAGATGTLDTEYGYDAAGNLASRTDPKGHQTTWTYDLDRRMTARTTPVGSWNTTYDANSNTKTVETPAGSATGTAGDGMITYGYDRMSRLTSVNYSDSTPDVSRTYDLAGRPATMTDGAGGTVTYTHDNADRLTAISRSGASAGLNGTLEYSYDNADNITGRTYPDSTTVAQTFDDDGRLATVASGGQTTTFGYDAAGNITTVTLPSGNGHVATRTFDRASRLTTVENAKAGTILSKFAWTLDAASNPTKAQTTRGGSDTYDAYEYDARNRLTASCYGIPSSATNCTGASNAINYAYDKVSNRTQEVRTGSVGNTGTIDSTYNSADQLTSTTKGGVTTNYTYDTNGNQASEGSRTFTYDLADRLISTTSGGTTSTYGYDGDDRRVTSTTSGGADLRYVWDPLAETGLSEVTLERTPSGSVVRRYVGGPLGAVSLTDTSATFYYHQDPLNSVSDMTDSSGAAQWRYEYEPYGAERSATNVSGTAPPNRVRFNGQYLDPETTQYHLRARQYDPATARFGGLDPVEGPLAAAYDAAYLYAGARPTVLTDPSGLDPRWGQGSAQVNVNCAKHTFLCVLIYNAGYTDGCSGSCVGRTIAKLERQGVAFDKIVAASKGEGHIVPLRGGDYGPGGIYFVSRGRSPILLEVPKDPTCGFWCRLGQATTVGLGCDSEATCVIAAATLFVPGGGACRVGRMALRGARAAAGSGARAAARANMRRLGLANVSLSGRSFNSGRKALEAAGFRINRVTKSGRVEFVNPRTGAIVSYDPRRAGRAAHWHIKDKGGQTYDRLGREVSSDAGKAHIPGR
jgi:RHS repeat-associated protein